METNPIQATVGDYKDYLNVSSLWHWEKKSWVPHWLFRLFARVVSDFADEKFNPQWVKYNFKYTTTLPEKIDPEEVKNNFADSAVKLAPDQATIKFLSGLQVNRPSDVTDRPKAVTVKPTGLRADSRKRKVNASVSKTRQRPRRQGRNKG